MLLTDDEIRAVKSAAREAHSQNVKHSWDRWGTASYDPVVPAYHAWKEWREPPPHSSSPKPWSPTACGTCGLEPAMHEGWEERAFLAARYQNFDRWDLLHVVDRLERALAEKPA